jgi:exodeoxyribonuclease VII small subunit
MKKMESIVENLSFEEAFDELEKIVEILETSNASLSESMTLYEKGQQLLKHCTQLIKDADIKLQTLNDSEDLSATRSAA